MLVEKVGGEVIGRAYVVHVEERDGADDDGDQTFETEDPLPPVQPSNLVHLNDAIRKNAAESTRASRRTTSQVVNDIIPADKYELKLTHRTRQYEWPSSPSDTTTKYKSSTQGTIPPQSHQGTLG